MGNRLPRTKRKLKSAIKRELKRKLRAERVGKKWSPELRAWIPGDDPETESVADAEHE